MLDLSKLDRMEAHAKDLRREIDDLKRDPKVRELQRKSAILAELEEKIEYGRKAVWS